MRRAKLTMLLAAAAAVAALGGCMSKAKRHLYTAEELFEKRDLKGAKLELQAAIEADPTLLDAHKSLAHVDEYLGDEEGAAREYEAASRLDPSDTKLLNKARYYRGMEELGNSAAKALDDIEAGRDEAGVQALADILAESKQKTAHNKAVAALSRAAPIIARRGDTQLRDGKYDQAAKTYTLAIRAYLLLGEANGKQQLDPATDSLMHSLNTAAKAAGTPDGAFTILNDALAFDPDNKVANAELARVYLAHQPPDYGTAADLMERAGASDAEVKMMRARAKRH